MKATKKISVRGEWATKGNDSDKDIKDADVITILDGGKITTSEYGEQKVFKVKTRNGEKNLSLNQTSENNLIDAFGDSTEDWIGKEVKVWLIRTSTGKWAVYLAPKDWIMNDEGEFVSPARPDEMPF